MPITEQVGFPDHTEEMTAMAQAVGAINPNEIIGFDENDELIVGGTKWFKDNWKKLLIFIIATLLYVGLLYLGGVFQMLSNPKYPLFDRIAYSIVFVFIYGVMFWFTFMAY